MIGAGEGTTETEGDHQQQEERDQREEQQQQQREQSQPHSDVETDVDGDRHDDDDDDDDDDEDRLPCCSPSSLGSFYNTLMNGPVSEIRALIRHAMGEDDHETGRRKRMLLLLEEDEGVNAGGGRGGGRIRLVDVFRRVELPEENDDGDDDNDDDDEDEDDEIHRQQQQRRRRLALLKLLHETLPNDFLTEPVDDDDDDDEDDDDEQHCLEDDQRQRQSRREIVNKMGKYPLHYLCHYRSHWKFDVDVVRYVVNAFPLAAVSRDRIQGRTPLHEACYCTDVPLQIVRILVESTTEAISSSTTSTTTTTTKPPGEGGDLNKNDTNVRYGIGASSRGSSSLSPPSPSPLTVADMQGRTPLHLYCCVNSNVKVAEYLIREERNGCPASSSSSLPVVSSPSSPSPCSPPPSLAMADVVHGQLPLHMCLENRNKTNGIGTRDHFDLVKLLVSAHPGAVTVKDRDGDLPVHIACYSAFDCIDAVVQEEEEQDGEFGGGINEPEGDGERHGDDDERGMVRRVRTERNMLSTVEELVSAYPESIAIPNGDGQTMLDLTTSMCAKMTPCLSPGRHRYYWRSRSGPSGGHSPSPWLPLRLLRLLVEFDPSVVIHRRRNRDGVDGNDRRTELHRVCCHARPNWNVVRIMVESAAMKKGNNNNKKKIGRGPTTTASGSANSEVVVTGAAPSSRRRDVLHERDGLGRLPLHCVCQCVDVEIDQDSDDTTTEAEDVVAYILRAENGGDHHNMGDDEGNDNGNDGTTSSLTSTDDRGRTPLHYACSRWHGSLTVVKWLLRHNDNNRSAGRDDGDAVMSMTDDDGATPLIAACEPNKVDDPVHVVYHLVRNYPHHAVRLPHVARQLKDPSSSSSSPYVSE